MTKQTEATPRDDGRVRLLRRWAHETLNGINSSSDASDDAHRFEFAAEELESTLYALTALRAECDAHKGERDTAVWLLERWVAGGFHDQAPTLAHETTNFIASLGRGDASRIRTEGSTTT